MNCPDCGAQIRDGATFCQSCGKVQVQGDASPALGASQAPQQPSSGPGQPGSSNWAKVVLVAVVIIGVICIACSVGIGFSRGFIAVNTAGTPSSLATGNASAPTSNSVPVAQTVDDYSWDELARISAEIANAPNESAAISIAQSYRLVNENGKLDGSEIKFVQLANGLTLQVQIIGFAHDDKSSGGKAGITFAFRDAIAMRAMNPTNDHNGGWKDSAMRSWLASEGLSMLPQDLASRIVAVEKRTNNDGTTKSANSVTATSDKLWLCSIRELVGDAEQLHFHSDTDALADKVLDSEGTQYKLYRDCGVSPSGPNPILVKGYGDGVASWYTRTPRPVSYGFFCVSEDGSFNFEGGAFNANEFAGVVPAFCI